MKRKRLKKSRYMQVVGRSSGDTGKLSRTLGNKPGSHFSEDEMMVRGYIKRPSKKVMMSW
jgi:hypothetical protein